MATYGYTELRIMMCFAIRLFGVVDQDAESSSSLCLLVGGQRTRQVAEPTLVSTEAFAKQGAACVGESDLFGPPVIGVLGTHDESLLHQTFQQFTPGN